MRLLSWKYEQAKDPTIIYFSCKHNDNLNRGTKKKPKKESSLHPLFFFLSQGSFLFFSFTFPFLVSSCLGVGHDVMSG